ncbi:basic helix-loop-helix (bHLH) DNA-binding superfamily protein [Zea mays]|uniref:Basic helix-loop-helix (BHLH) DNA-binding superfamily protein n=1 Tax=Zea mays TaxID=4577 RepID=A0A1D6E7B5_MAIZE|nr:basic helix-loop-helix (bHLH) DNA-binding superfamily protein [Zea mays]
MMMAEVVANHSKRSHTDGYFSAKAAVAAAAAASPPEELGSMPMSSKKPRPRNSNSPRTAPVSPKEKKDRIGERVAALQQLVSPFGKTDTASVLQEASGYIRFLHQQLQVGVPPVTARMVAGTTYVTSSVRFSPSFLSDDGQWHRPLQVLSSPYMRAPPAAGAAPEDPEHYSLRSRGLCLVPVDQTLQLTQSNGADLWAPANTTRRR